MAPNATYQYKTNVEEMKQYVVNVMSKVGTDPEHAKQLADLLIYADQRGHYSHGLNRLTYYAEDIATGLEVGKGTPKILKQKGSTAWVDGQNLLGAVVGNFSMKLAIQLAKEHGVGWVCAKGSNHFGACGFYSTQAAREGLVGLAFTNASPTTFSPRSAELATGNNPLSFIAEGEHGDSFALDMANSTVALGKVEVARRLGKKEVLSGWGCDSNGVPTTDPNKILNGGGLLPLGCFEETGGYKGQGLCMMVEIMCGVMGGAAFGTNIRQWHKDPDVANLGQCFIAVDPECFADGFAHRLQQFIDQTRGLKPKDPELPVLVAGDPERTHLEKSKKHGGLIYPAAQVEHLNQLADKHGAPRCSFQEI
uniref:Malate dehydrogenase n=1 Tax=Acrobeloides nanus TaxID=290746 RepID=A0A914E2R3_9BILA